MALARHHIISKVSSINCHDNNSMNKIYRKITRSNRSSNSNSFGMSQAICKDRYTSSFMPLVFTAMLRILPSHFWTPKRTCRYRKHIHILATPSLGKLKSLPLQVCKFSIMVSWEIWQLMI